MGLSTEVASQKSAQCMRIPLKLWFSGSWFQSLATSGARGWLITVEMLPKKSNRKVFKGVAGVFPNLSCPAP